MALSRQKGVRYGRRFTANTMYFNVCITYGKSLKKRLIIVSHHKLVSELPCYVSQVIRITIRRISYKYFVKLFYSYHTIGNDKSCVR